MVYKTAEEMRKALMAIGAKECITSFIRSTEEHLTSNIDFFSTMQSEEYACNLRQTITDIASIKQELALFKKNAVETKDNGLNDTTRSDALYLVGRIYYWVEYLDSALPDLEFLLELAESTIRSSLGYTKEEFEKEFTSTERGETIVNLIYERAIRTTEKFKLHLDFVFDLFDVQDAEDLPF